MKVDQTPTGFIEQLRCWFHPKDRSVVLADSCFVEGQEISTPGNPIAGRRRLYAKTDGWYDLDNAGIELPVGCWLPITTPVELTAPVASVTFAAIPQHFRSLLLANQVRTDVAGEADNVLARFNGDAGANYDYVHLYGRGNNTRTSVGGIAVTSIALSLCEGANSRANVFSPSLSYLSGYTSASAEKIVNSCPNSIYGNRDANTDFYVWVSGGAWRSINAITSITYLPSLGANFVAGSIFQVYGLA